MIFILDKKPFLFLTFGFILFTILGTLSHELGHYLAATFLGYSAEINYATTFTNNVSPGSHDSFLITLGGITQTLLTGSIGVLLLIRYKRKFSKTNLTFRQWIIVFLGLFWLRQLFNLFLVIIKKTSSEMLSQKNDEINLSTYLRLPELSISILTAILSLVIFSYVFFAIPISQRFTFLIALGFGCSIGFITWMFWLGPALIP